MYLLACVWEVANVMLGQAHCNAECMEKHAELSMEAPSVVVVSVSEYLRLVLNVD